MDPAGRTTALLMRQKACATENYWRTGTPAAIIFFYEIVAYNKIYEDLVGELTQKCDEDQKNALTRLRCGAENNHEKLLAFASEQKIVFCPQRMRARELLISLCPHFRRPANDMMMDMMMDMMLSQLARLTGVPRRQGPRPIFLIDMALHEGTYLRGVIQFLSGWLSNMTRNEAPQRIGTFHDKR